MKQQNAFVRSALALSVLTLVSACGGGGGGSTTQTPAPTPVAQVTFGQAEASPLAGVSLLTAELMLSQKQLEHAFFAGLIKGFANSPSGGSSPAGTVTCVTAAGGSGTLTASITKAGTYAGLATGDQLNISFNACNFGGGALTLNGNSLLTSRGNYSSLSTNFLALYTVRNTNFDMILGTSKFRMNGTETVTFDAIANGENYPQITTDVATTAAVSFFSPSTATAPTLTYTASSPVRMVSKTTVTNTFTSSLDGPLSVASGTSVIPMEFATPAQFAGNINTVTGRPTPTAGTLRVKDTSANHLTETTIQGLSAVLKADTNGDGVLDAAYNTTYVALTTF
jgi:hypothetical protein